MHRRLVAVIRHFAEHLFFMADLIETEPFNDDAMLMADARFGALHDRMRAASEKFASARFCTGGIQ